MKKILTSFAIALMAVSIAGAKTFQVTLFQTTKVGQAELKPGEYKLEWKSDKVRITNGRQTGEATVKVQNAERKFTTTTVKSNNGRVEEIRLGGTSTTLVFPQS